MLQFALYVGHLLGRLVMEPPLQWRAREPRDQPPLEMEQQGRLVIRAAPTNGSNLLGRLTHQPPLVLLFVGATGD